LSGNEYVQVPSLQIADLKLPAEVKGLYDLSYNLAWTWNPEARLFFASIDRPSWARYRNPVELLLNVDPHQWETLVHDDAFMANLLGLVRGLEEYVDPKTETWFGKRFPGYTGGPIAYFSMEYGLHQSLPIYSGGLGVLSGDHCKSASELGVPMVALGLLYRSGYFRQTLDADGFQQHFYPRSDFQRLPLKKVLDPHGRELVVRVPLPEREVAVQAWLAQVGRVPLLLLDTDLVQNDPADREIASVLYVRGRETRLIQEAVLGIGGVKVLAELGIEPGVWHINEGHSALLQLERLRALTESDQSSLEAALEKIRRSTAFTTHTPVPAGNEQFDRTLARTYLDVWAKPLGVDAERLLALGEADHGEAGQPLNLTALALRTCGYANGVSELNGRVGDRMWRHLFPELEADERAIHGITNGIHVPTWLGVEMRDLIARHLGSDWREALLEPDGWNALLEVADADLWQAHQAQKERLGRFARSRVRQQYARHGRSPAALRAVSRLLDPEILTVGFARRFATYKRAGLLFSDMHRLRALLNHPGRPMQVVLAGKAHPADRPGQELIRHIFQLSQQPDLNGRVVFLEGYDMRIGRMMVQGCDVWLNTPRRPLEASGTSGQKAAMNGCLNLSVLDGWWPEAFDGTNGWAIGDAGQQVEDWQQDQRDAHSLYSSLEEQVAPRYYERDGEGLPSAWLEMMKRSIATIAPRFSARRMVRDYVEQSYLPLTGLGTDESDG
jgi:starch phosphorylase